MIRLNVCTLLSMSILFFSILCYEIILLLSVSRQQTCMCCPVSSEVILMRKQLNEALDFVTSLRDEKHSLEEKAGQLVGDIHMISPHWINTSLCHLCQQAVTYMSLVQLLFPTFLWLVTHGILRLELLETVIDYNWLALLMRKIIPWCIAPAVIYAI